MKYIKKIKRRWRKKMRGGSRQVSKIPGYTSSKNFSSRRRTKNDRSRFWIRLRLGGVMIGLPLLVVLIRFYFNIIRELPEISDIENTAFNQATVITDRNDVTLYKLYEENRDIIAYGDISQNFVNAIVATEDQRFWENPGVDWKGIIRAGITDVRYGKTHGGSTITQQVIKNLLLTPEKKITRKLKEIILAVKLVNYISDDVSNKYSDLSNKEIDKKVKEEIMELYANYIFLGNNSYGVEIASQTYFGTSAKDLTPLQGAILAGIPQAPSRYDPYTARGLLMGEIIIENLSVDADIQSPVDISQSVAQQISQDIKAKVNDANLGNKKDDSKLLSFLIGLLEYKQTIGGVEYAVSYELGRKDAVIGRMYEMGFISEEELKKSFTQAIDFEFNRDPISIKAPHFVFWVIEQLEKEYDPEVLRTGGLKIKTTLDYEIQKLAETSIRENAGHYNTYNAYNSSLVYLDSLNGDILAYVGSRDYNDDDIDGQVDMVKALRQPGSTIKPFVYGLGFMNLKLTLDSPIYDIKFKVGPNEPQNADGEFRGLTTLREALAGSRNIPAIKMFLSVGGEQIVKNFLEGVGFSKLIMDRDHYGYALGLGAAETPMLELANAYAHLSAMGKPAEINPILEVRGADNSLLYKKKIKLQDQVIPGGVAFLLRDILSSKTNFPEDWRSNFTIPGLEIATKSGTTNVVQGENKLPRDGRLSSYTPSKVLVMRGGNTDGSPMRYDAYGGWLNSPSRKSFLNGLKNQQYIQSETMQEREVKQVNISLLSGKLPSTSTPLVFMKKSLGYIYSLPTEYDNQVSSYEIDTLCNGKPSDLTPPDALGLAWYVRPETIMPDKYDQDDVITRWSNGGASRFGGGYTLSAGPSQECEERLAIAELGEISLDLMQPVEGQTVTRTFSMRHQTKSPFQITDMRLYLGDIELETITYDKNSPLADIRNVVLPAEIEDGTYVFKSVVWDDKGYSDSRSVRLNVSSVAADTVSPYLLEDKIQVRLMDDGSYEVTLLFGDDASSIGDGTLFAGGTPIHTFQGNVANFGLTTVGDLSYLVYDTSGNKVEGTIVLNAPDTPTPDEAIEVDPEEIIDDNTDITSPTPTEESIQEGEPILDDTVVEAQPSVNNLFPEE